MTQQLRSEALAPNDLASSIRRLANGRSTLDVAQFQFVGFNEIRQRYGAQWPAKRDRVRTVARHFVGKRVDADDLIIPGADGFLIIFSQKSGVAADTAAQRLGRELNDFFSSPGSEHADVSVEAHYRPMSVADMAQALSIAVGGAEEDLAPPPAPATAPASSALASPPIPADQVRFTYQPVWDPRREAIIQYLMRPSDPSTGLPMPGYHYECGAEASCNYSEIDERQLLDSEEALRKLAESGHKALIGVQLRLPGLKNSISLARFGELLDGFDASLKRYRVIRITGIEPGFPSAYLCDAIRKLKVHSPNIAIGFSLAEPNPALALEAAPSAIGFQVSPNVTEAEVQAKHTVQIRSLAEAARAKGIPMFVNGVFGADAARRMVFMGVEQLSSPSIWPIIDAPQAAHRWLMIRLAEC